MKIPTVGREGKGGGHRETEDRKEKVIEQVV